MMEILTLSMDKSYFWCCAIGTDEKHWK